MRCKQKLYHVHLAIDYDLAQNRIKSKLRFGALITEHKLPDYEICYKECAGGRHSTRVL